MGRGQLYNYILKGNIFILYIFKQSTFGNRLNVWSVLQNVAYIGSSLVFGTELKFLFSFWPRFPCSGLENFI